MNYENYDEFMKKKKVLKVSLFLHMIVGSLFFCLLENYMRLV